MSNPLAVRDTSLERYMVEVNKHPVLSRDEEYELAVRYHDQGDLEAAHRLVVGNLRFVVKVAHEFRGYGFRLLDLVQEGNVGLMMAVKKFNPHKGYRLISYAVWWIRAQIQSFVLRSWSMVKMGSSRLQRKLFFRLRSARSRAEQEAAGAGISTADLAEVLDASEAEILRMEGRLASRDFSLDAQLGEGTSSMTHLDLVEDGTLNQEEALGAAEEEHQLRGKVATAMATLNEKERFIVENRLLADEPATLQEIGDKFSVSRERIRQLEERVMKKLRDSFPSAQAAMTS